MQNLATAPLIFQNTTNFAKETEKVSSRATVACIASMGDTQLQLFDETKRKKQRFFYTTQEKTCITKQLLQHC